MNNCDRHSGLNFKHKNLRYFQIYSVTHGIVSIELLAKGGEININEELLKRGYAISCEESYDSKVIKHVCRAIKSMIYV